MLFSSDPHSDLNEARQAFYWARQCLGLANRGLMPRSHGMQRLNRARARLRRIAKDCRGRPVATCYSADLESTVAGIPCGIKVTRYLKGWAGSLWEEPVEEEIEFIVLDRGGYQAHWLQAKMSDADQARIERMIRDA